jgi:hypothetical protein
MPTKKRRGKADQSLEEGSKFLWAGFGRGSVAWWAPADSTKTSKWGKPSKFDQVNFMPRLAAAPLPRDQASHQPVVSHKRRSKTYLQQGFLNGHILNKIQPALTCK